MGIDRQIKSRINTLLLSNDTALLVFICRFVGSCQSSCLPTFYPWQPTCHLSSVAFHSPLFWRGAGVRLFLHKPSDYLLLLSRQHINHRYFYHRVATGLLAHRGACHVYKHLTC